MELRDVMRNDHPAWHDEAFGAPTFQVRAKNFAMVRQSEGGTSVWCKAPPGAQAAYLISEPDRYFAPPYLGPKGWVAAWIDPGNDPDWNEITAIIEESYRRVAPKRLVARLDTFDPATG